MDDYSILSNNNNISVNYIRDVKKRNSLRGSFKNLPNDILETPNIKNMEKTIYKIKPQLISNKLPSAFEIPKFSSNIKEGLLITQENSENKNIKANQHVKQNSTVYNKYNLEPIKMNTARKTVLKNILEANIESDQKVIEEEKSPIGKSNKLILKPIEIKDPRKMNSVKKNESSKFIEHVISNNLNNQLLPDIKNQNGSPFLQKTFEKFSKTSDFKFKILENIENYQNDISRLEENLNLQPGEIIKNIHLMKNMFNNQRGGEAYSNKNLLSIDVDSKSNYYAKYNNNLATNKGKIQKKNKSNQSVCSNRESVERLEKIETQFGNKEQMYRLKLEEMITLNLIPTENKTYGIVRKMLHGGNFNIYIAREVPLTNPSIRQGLKHLIQTWETLQNSSRHLLNIWHNYLNTPEGYQSIIMEYCSFGSLQNLINNNGILPENIIQTIAYQTIRGLESYYLKTNNGYNSLCPENIYFDKKCTLKVTFIYLF
jgi:hypothetical protein